MTSTLRGPEEVRRGPGSVISASLLTRYPSVKMQDGFAVVKNILQESSNPLLSPDQPKITKTILQFDKYFPELYGIGSAAFPTPF